MKVVVCFGMFLLSLAKVSVCMDRVGKPGSGKEIQSTWTRQVSEKYSPGCKKYDATKKVIMRRYDAASQKQEESLSTWFEGSYKGVSTDSVCSKIVISKAQ